MTKDILQERMDRAMMRSMLSPTNQCLKVESENQELKLLNGNANNPLVVLNCLDN